MYAQYLSKSRVFEGTQQQLSVLPIVLSTVDGSDER